MKQRIKIGFSLILVIFLTQCKKDDELKTNDPKESLSGVCFEIPKGDLYAEVELIFDASCSDENVGSYYVWDMGDESTKTGKTISYTYSEPGEYTITLSIAENSYSEPVTHQRTITILPSPYTKHCDDINGDEVWEEGMHLVCSSIDINGSLTIKPGAEVFFEEKKKIIINGKLLAQGTQDSPITFLPISKAITPGSWGYIHFSATASSESILEYCELKYGGNAGYSYPTWEYYTDYGVIHLEECQISIKNTLIEGAANFGISLSENAKFKAFDNNTFTANRSNSLKIHANAVESIGQTNTFSGEKDILVIGTEYFRPGKDITWYKQDVPYYIDGSINLLDDISFTIEAGVVFELESDNMMNVGYFRVVNGSLTAIGTEAEPIVFTSAKAEKNMGDWAGLMISSNSVLEHCVIEYTGSEYTASGYQRGLQIKGSDVTIKHCTISECSSVGVSMEASNATFTNNTLKNCSGYGVTVDVKQYQHIDKSNIFENTGGFHVSSGSGINEDMIIEKRDYPYVLTGFYLYSNATLTIEPGTEIQFRSRAGITLGYNVKSSSSIYSGNLIANGTAEELIKFSLYFKDKEGGEDNWGSISFGEESTTSVLNNCIITDGGNVVDGNGREYPEMGMIHCYKTTGFPSITNCTISNSSEWAITLNQSTITSSNNTFSNNKEGDTISY